MNSFLFQRNPAKRPSAQQALRYPYFQLHQHQDAGNGTLIGSSFMSHRGQRSVSEPRGEIRQPFFRQRGWCIFIGNSHFSLIQGSEAGGRTRVKWGHDMNDDDFEEVAVVKSNPVDHGRSQSGGLPSIYQNGQYQQNQHLNGYRGSSSYPTLGSKSYGSNGATGESSSRSPSAGLSGRVDWKSKYLK